MGCAPIDVITVIADRELLMCCINEWRNPAHDRFARNLMQQLVAIRASREGGATWIEGITRHHFAKLIAKGKIKVPTTYPGA